MFEHLKDKLNRLYNKKNKSPLAQYFQDPDYPQNKEKRHAQLLFYKLLMITAYSDNSVDQQEIDLIKDYVYDQCLTEEEWREIDFFGRIKPTQEEIEKLLTSIINEIKSKREKEQFLQAIQELIDADDIIGPEEREILDLIKEKLETTNVSIMGNLLRNIQTNLQNKKKEYINTIELASVAYGKNPIAPVLAQLVDKERLPQLEIVAAKLGLAIIMIHSDMEFHEKEKEAFEILVAEECGLPEKKARDVAAELLKIPDNFFEIAYLARLIADSVDEQERKKILRSLFTIARADQVYSAFEDKYLKIISKYLFIEPKDFIALKIKSNEQ